MMLKQRQIEGRTEIFDLIRKKWVILTEEEKVRQFFIHFIIDEKKIPTSHISVEKQISVNQLTKRYDIVVYDRQGKAALVVECKAPEVKIGQQVFDQVARYNLDFQVDWLVVTNGLSHYCCRLDRANNRCIFAEQIPYYEAINQ